MDHGILLMHQLFKAKHYAQQKTKKEYLNMTKKIIPLLNQETSQYQLRAILFFKGEEEGT